MAAVAAGTPTTGSRGCGLKSMPSWFPAGLLPDALDLATAAELLPVSSGPTGGIAGLALQPGDALGALATGQQSELSPSTQQLQQLTGPAGRAVAGWVKQVAEGGVLVSVPADQEGALQQEAGDLGSLDPLSELIHAGERVDVGGGGRWGPEWASVREKRGRTTSDQVT